MSQNASAFPLVAKIYFGAAALLAAGFVGNMIGSSDFGNQGLTEPAELSAEDRAQRAVRPAHVRTEI